MVNQVSSMHKSTHLYPLLTNHGPLYDIIRKQGILGWKGHAAGVRSDINPRPREIFAKLLGRAVFLALEYPVEVGNVVEPTPIGNLRYGLVGIDQQARGVAQSDFVEAVDECLAGAFLDKTAERGFVHIDAGSHGGQGD